MNPETPTPPPPADPAPAAEGEIQVLTPKGRREPRPARAMRGHDFRQSGFLTPSELRRIRMRHEQFVRALAARLAIFLRVEFTVRLAKVQIVIYQHFTDSLPSPTHITLFRVEPLKGVGLLALPARLGLSLVDRSLGGPGQMPQTARELSEIEIALTDQIVALALTEWCSHWPEMPELRHGLLGHESNSRFLQTAPPETAMLILSLEMGMGEQLETVQIAFPYSTVEPLMRLLSPALPEAEPTPARSATPRWNPEFGEVKIKTSAEWQGLKISAAELTRLKPGDVLMLSPESAGQVHLRLSEIPKFIGRPGVCGQKWAVQLTQAIND